MSFLPGIKSWLNRNRTSARMAFVLRMVTMGVGSLFGLVWTRLLLQAMGAPLLGLFQDFQGITRLGGLGDFGITGALSLKVGTLLGRKDDSGLRALLNSARTLFLLIAVALCVLFIGMSPWLPHWLNFADVPGTGSMTLLFVYGGLSIAVFILGGYFASLNYAYGTVTWPILPTMLLVQILAPFFHWRLAVWHFPLWIQLLPYLIAGVMMMVLSWAMLKWSHPWLGEIRPLKGDRAEWKTLANASWWVYLISVGTAIYVVTDRFVITAGFDTAVVPMYLANYKICELSVTLLTTAAFVSFPKVTQWISSTDEADRRRLLMELKRLRAFEIVLGCGAVLGYLAFNHAFVGLWLGEDLQGPLALQFAFAANLAVTICGNAGIQLSIRAGDRGLKLAGLAVVGTGLLNLVLSILSVKYGPGVAQHFGFGDGVAFGVTGVATATVIAQSISSICLGAVTCHYLNISAWEWTARCWFLPMAFIGAAATLKCLFPHDSLSHLGILSACYAVLLLALAGLAGMNRELLSTELAQLRKMLRR